LEASTNTGLRELEHISSSDNSGYSVLGKLSRNEYEDAKEIYGMAYGFEDLDAEQAKLKTSLTKLNLDVADLAKKLKIDVPYKVL